jgi:hypothetical protein
MRQLEKCVNNYVDVDWQQHIDQMNGHALRPAIRQACTHGDDEQAEGLDLNVGEPRKKMNDLSVDRRMPIPKAQRRGSRSGAVNGFVDQASTPSCAIRKE